MSSPATDAIAVSDAFCLYSVPGGASVAALRGLSLRVAAGERLVVHGPNGSGKTTLLRVLSGEVPVSSGSVRVAGIELSAPSAARSAALRRKSLGFIDQHSGRALRAELTVTDNVALQARLAGVARDEARNHAVETLRELGLGDLAGRRPTTLSAGEAQRVAVCAAIAHRPAVVLADEPTGELDGVAADAVYEMLAEAVQRVAGTLLLVTHDTRAARVADRVVRIRDGRLSEEWAPDSPERPALVVDDRGWLRLPDAVRASARIGTSVDFGLRAAEVVLTAAVGQELPAPAAPLAAVPAGPTGAHQEPSARKPLARLEAVSLRYGPRVVFDGLSLALRPGRLTIVHGRSGAGKSTLLRLLIGLLDPDAGEVELAGRTLRGLDRSARAALRRDAVGVVTQAGALAEPLNTLENLAIARTVRGLPADTDTTNTVIDRLALTALVRRPVGLLSGGERQRVALARALVVQRPLLVLDEPTSQQDEAHAERVVAALRASAAGGVAVACATHDQLLVEAADDILELT